LQKSLLTIFILSGILVLASYLIGSCRKNENPNGLQWVQQEIPAGFPQPVYTFTDNPLSKEGYELGRRLFYDGRLSIDNLHSCSSCHQQIGGFGTFEHDRSHGVNNSHTLRNAPVLINLAWQTSFHWDGEFRSLKEEAVQPINGHIEMGESWNGVIDKLLEDPGYRDQFTKVFRGRFIRPEFIVQALAQFTGSIISADSKYDRVKKGTANFTSQEQNGYQLYKVKCASCHAEPLFTDYTYRNIGLPVDNFLNDYGRIMVTGKKEDSLKFKVPTLRNVYISSNYMHDGRFNTLQQCMNHYRTGVQQSATLDPLIGSGIILTNTEAADLVIFLRALTDSSILTNPRYSKPN
jgi:cytochrome c peroxidase